MNVKHQPPVFVPALHLREVEALSKAALMDMVWDYAQQFAESGGAIDEFRKRREIINTYRARVKGGLTKAEAMIAAPGA